MKQKRILFIEFLKVTAANHLSMMIKGLLTQSNCTMVLLCQRSSYLAKSLKNHSIKIYEIDYEEIRVKNIRSYISYIRQSLLIFYIIIKHHITLIHCHRLNWAYLCVVPSLLLRIPLFVHIVIIEKLTSRFQNWLLHIHKNIRYIAVSKYAVQAFKKLYNRDVHFVTYHYGGLFFPDMEIGRGKNNEAIESIQLSGKRIIAMISRMDPLKGVDVFIEAAALLSKKHDDLQFIHIGNHKDYIFRDKYFSDCKRRVKELRLTPAFHFLDYTDEILTVYKYFYLCVLPTYADTLSYVNLEANYNKIPVIFTDTGGLMETTSKRFSCSIPYPPSAVLLSQKIDQLLHDEQEYKKLQNEVSHFVMNQFNAEKNSPHLIRIYSAF